MRRNQSFALLAAAVLCLALTLSACGGIAQEESPVETPEQESGSGFGEEEKTVMQMKIDDVPVSVEWEENASVDALMALAVEEPLTVQMSMYGGFEQVGSLGQRLPRDDAQTTAAAGDVVLYSGNQLVVFYGSNAWTYTRLGHITDKTAAELAELLGNGDVTITIEAKSGAEG